jgi:hypothetical protein
LIEAVSCSKLARKWEVGEGKQLVGLGNFLREGGGEIQRIAGDAAFRRRKDRPYIERYLHQATEASLSRTEQTTHESSAIDAVDTTGSTCYACRSYTHSA